MISDVARQVRLVLVASRLGLLPEIFGTAVVVSLRLPFNNSSPRALVWPSCSLALSPRSSLTYTKNGSKPGFGRTSPLDTGLGRCQSPAPQTHETNGNNITAAFLPTARRRVPHELDIRLAAAARRPVLLGGRFFSNRTRARARLGPPHEHQHRLPQRALRAATADCAAETALIDTTRECVSSLPSPCPVSLTTPDVQLPPAQR